MRPDLGAFAKEMMWIDIIISRPLRNGYPICGLQIGVGLKRRGTFIHAIFSSLKTIKLCQFACGLHGNDFTELFCFSVSSQNYGSVCRTMFCT